MKEKERKSLSTATSSVTKRNVKNSTKDRDIQIRRKRSRSRERSRKQCTDMDKRESHQNRYEDWEAPFNPLFDSISVVRERRNNQRKAKTPSYNHSHVFTQKRDEQCGR